MSVQINWNYLFPILGTLLGAFSGFLGNFFLNRWRDKKERETAYRTELRQHFDDFLKPFFIALSNFGSTLPILNISLEASKYHSTSYAIDRASAIKNCENRFYELITFVNEHKHDIAIYLPEPFEWIFVPYEEIVFEIIQKARQEKHPKDEIVKAWNTSRSIRTDLRKLLGYEINIEIETKYPFE